MVRALEVMANEMFNLDWPDSLRHHEKGFKSKNMAKMNYRGLYAAYNNGKAPANVINTAESGCR